MTIIYDEPAATYHANPALGSTDIRSLIKSPALFRDRMDALDERETPALLFGTASHMALLEPTRFAAECAVRPEGIDFRTTIGKQWRDDHADKIIVSQADAIHLHYMHERMPAEIRSILAAGKCEVTVRTKINAIDVQCRIDCWSGDGSVLYDLKTIGDIDYIEKSVWKYSYHIQDRWYGRVVATETDKKRPAFRFIFVEKKPPYRWRIVELDADYQMRADDAIGGALLDLEERTRTGDWADPGELRMMVSPPSWLNDDETDDEE